MPVGASVELGTDAFGIGRVVGSTTSALSKDVISFDLGKILRENLDIEVGPIPVGVSPLDIVVLTMFGMAVKAANDQRNADDTPDNEGRARKFSEFMFPWMAMFPGIPGFGSFGGGGDAGSIKNVSPAAAFLEGGPGETWKSMLRTGSPAFAAGEAVLGEKDADVALQALSPGYWIAKKAGIV